MREQILLIGGGGHARSVIDSIRQHEKYEIIGIIDKMDKVGTEINGVKILGTDEDLERIYKKGIRYAFITIGSIGNSTGRMQLYHIAKNIGYIFPNIIDSTAILAKNLKIGEGCFIGKGSIINTDVIIGSNCIINTGAIIEHDCKIEDFVHIGPGSVLCGDVKIGNATHIGVNTTIIEGKRIGEYTLIGAGSVVVDCIGDQVKAYGCPCKEVGINE